MGMYRSFLDGARRGRRDGLALRSVLIGISIVVLTLSILVCCFGAMIIAIGA